MTLRKPRLSVPSPVLPPPRVPARSQRWPVDREGALKVLLAFLKEASAEELKRVPLLGGFIAATEKLSEEQAGREAAERIERLLDLAGGSQAGITQLREDIDVLTSLTMAVFAMQGELHTWLESTQQRTELPALTELAVETALLTYRVRVAIDYQYADHRGIGEATMDARVAALPLDEVYVLPRLVPSRASTQLQERERWLLRQLDDPDMPIEQRRQLEEEFAALTGQRWRPGEGLSIGDALGDARHCVILGPPGVGKSVLTRYLARTCALGASTMADRLGWVEDLTPVVLPLAAFASARSNHPELTIREFLDQRIMQRGGQALYQALGEEIEAGRALILLDGIDEVPNTRARVGIVRAVDDFIADLGASRSVVTSRPHGYIPLAGDLPHFQLPNFSEAQIEEFLVHWHRSFERRQHPDAPDLAHADTEAAVVLAELRRNSKVLQLASNPLMLVIVALIRYKQLRLPEQRVELYSRAVATLMDTWNLWRSTVAETPEESGTLSIKQLIKVWAAVALWMHSEKPTGVDHRGDLQRQLASVLVDLEIDDADPESTAEAYLDVAARRAGLLEERAPDIFGFWHATFEEYLAAVALAMPAAQSARRLLPLRQDPRWREVVLLTVGHIGVIQDDDETATQLVDQIAHAEPSPLEPLTRGHLRLAAACVADDVGVRRNIAQQLVRELGAVVFYQPYGVLSHTFANLIEGLPRLLPSPETLGTLLSLVHHEAWEVRMGVARLFANAATRSPVAREQCEQLVLDDDHDVRCHAALGLARAGDRNPRTWAALAHYYSSFANISAQVRQFMSHIGSADLTGLWLVLDDLPAYAIEEAEGSNVELLDEFEIWIGLAGLVVEANQVDENTIELLGDSIPENGQAYMIEQSTLVHIGRSGKQGLQILRLLLTYPEPDYQWRAGRALIELGQVDEQLLQVLAELLGDHSREASVEALQGFVQLAQADEEVVALLRELLADGSYRALRAGQALAELGRLDEEVVAAFRELRGDESPTLRLEAAQALAEWGWADEDISATFRSVLGDVDPRVRLEAVGALTELGLADEEGFAVFRGVLADAESPHYWEARQRLVMLGRSDDQVVAITRRLVRDEELSVRSQALTTLIDMNLPSEDMTGILREVLLDENPGCDFRRRKGYLNSTALKIDSSIHCKRYYQIALLLPLGIEQLAP